MIVSELLRFLQFVLGYSSLVYVAVAIWLWEAATKTHLPADIKWSLCAGALVVISFENWRSAIREAEAAKDALKAEQARAPEKREFAREPETLLAHYGQIRKLTDTRLMSYLDKWITVSGRFEGATESLVGDAIHVSVLLESGRRIPLRFPNANRDRLHGLREGQQITAVCQIQPSWEGFALANAEFALENAELAHA